MYSEAIIAANIERVERLERKRRSALGLPRADSFRLIRFESAIIEEMVEHIGKLIDQKSGKYVRDLTEHEQGFIDNELMVCQLDWRYWCENYAEIQLASQSDRPAGWDDADADDQQAAGARIGKFVLNGMQIQMLKKLAKLEEACYEALARGAPVNGILLIIHKARQLGASLMWQALLLHRVNFYSHINALTASIDDKNTQALFRRFERMYERMPIWMRAKIRRQTRETGIQFERDSVVELQSGRQDKDLGKGETWHAVHITEAASFDNLSRHLDEGLLPTVPFSIYTLYGVESTSDGKSGDWYDFVTAVMSGTAEGGAGRFAHYFAPFYLIDMEESSKGQRSKYRIEAPVGWEPSVATRMMALRVKASSHEYCDVEGLELHRDVLYWYESTRAYYHKRGKLNLFLQSFPIDAEESFQHSSAGAFPNDTIARLKDSAAGYDPWAYRIIGGDELPDAQLLVTDQKRVYPVAQYYLAPMSPIELEHERDMRGIIFLFEQPSDTYTYSLGADPTGGIPGWRREFRQHNDINTDNGAIEIFRKGKPGVTCETCAGRCWMPTESKGVTIECRACEGRGKIGGRAVQVAEFAAPIDAEELALYIYVIGRVFRGNSEFEECLAVIENNNTGILTIRKLQTVYEYINLYQSDTAFAANSTPKYTNSIGFFSGPTTVPLLHARSRSIVMRRDADVRSPHLIKEYSDAVVKITGTSNDSGDDGKARLNAIVVRERFVVKPGGGRHDDRMIASFLSFLGLFDIMEIGDGSDETGGYDAARKTVPDLAARDATAEEQQQAWNALVGEYTDGLLVIGEHYPDCALNCEAEHGIDEDGEEGESEFWESDLEYEEDAY